MLNFVYAHTFKRNKRLVSLFSILTFGAGHDRDSTFQYTKDQMHEHHSKFNYHLTF